MVSSVLPLASGQDGDAAMGHEQIRMEDLLQAQFDNEQNLVLFDGLASFSINMLIHQINKSESNVFWSGLKDWNIGQGVLIVRLEFYA